MLPPEGPPRASREEDLPGFTRTSRRPPFSVKKIFVILLFALFFTPAEGCLPSWFRQQRSNPAPLEGSGASQAEEYRGDLRAQRIQKPGTEYTPPEPDEAEEVEYEEEEEDEDGNLGELYGTAKPIAHDQQLEDAKKAFEETECPGWCFMGGTCRVDVDPVSYKYLGKECMCPPNYWGKRCDHHYIKRLYSPVRGQLHVERSAVPALAFFLIMVVITVGLAIYSYRKITKRNDPSSWRSSPSTEYSQQSHLRRNRAIYVGRSPFSPKLYSPKTPGPLLLQGGQLALPLSTVSPPTLDPSMNRGNNSSQMSAQFVDRRGGAGASRSNAAGQNHKKSSNRPLRLQSEQQRLSPCSRFEPPSNPL